MPRPAHFIIPIAAIALCAAAAVASRPRALPPGAVVVDHIPPDACVAFYGSGPCREHGTTITGSTDAVAGPPPANWHGRVQ